MNATFLTQSLTAIALASACSLVAAKSADVVVLMDESGSMAGEQAWMATTMPTLDIGLNAAGVTGNRYGLIGFGASAAPLPSNVRTFNVGGAQFGTAAQFQTASAGLVASGSTEDGWAAITAANGYGFAAGAVRNYILVTDEDRDNTFLTSFAAIRDSMTGTKTLLNAVVDANFVCGDGRAAIGIIGSTGYRADGAGGFIKCTGGAFGGTADGSTFADYVQLALATGGGAWDLNLLRAGGLSAESFTKAFIDGKVQEIVIQDPTPAVPEPSTYAMLAIGLAAAAAFSRRNRI